MLKARTLVERHMRYVILMKIANKDTQTYPMSCISP